jgi:hypothetical protein
MSSVLYQQERSADGRALDERRDSGAAFPAGDRERDVDDGRGTLRRVRRDDPHNRRPVHPKRASAAPSAAVLGPARRQPHRNRGRIAAARPPRAPGATRGGRNAVARRKPSSAPNSKRPRRIRASTECRSSTDRSTTGRRAPLPVSGEDYSRPARRDHREHPDLARPW